jgi:hypothetical protein
MDYEPPSLHLQHSAHEWKLVSHCETAAVAASLSNRYADFSCGAAIAREPLFPSSQKPEAMFLYAKQPFDRPSPHPTDSAGAIGGISVDARIVRAT